MPYLRLPPSEKTKQKNKLKAKKAGKTNLMANENCVESVLSFNFYSIRFFNRKPKWAAANVWMTIGHIENVDNRQYSLNEVH